MLKKIDKARNNNCWRGCGERASLLHCCWWCKVVQPLWKTVHRSHKKLKIELPYDPAIALLGIYPKYIEVVKRRAICIQMFKAALSTRAKSWKEARCPSTDDWFKKLWSIYTMEYYSAVKKEGFPNICCNMDSTGGENAKWNKSSRDRQLSYYFSHLWNIRTRKIGRRRKG